MVRLRVPKFQMVLPIPISNRTSVGQYARLILAWSPRAQASMATAKRIVVIWCRKKKVYGYRR